MMHLSHTLKAAALAASLIGLSAAAGCAPAYCHGYDCRGHGYYHNHYDRHYDRGSYRDRNDSYYRRDSRRHWVCDSYGDNCHWSYH